MNTRTVFVLFDHNTEVGTQFSRAAQQRAQDMVAVSARSVLQGTSGVPDQAGQIDIEEKRIRESSAAGTYYSHRQEDALQQELYEAYRLIDRLYRRFPETRDSQVSR